MQYLFCSSVLKKLIVMHACEMEWIFLSYNWLEYVKYSPSVCETACFMNLFADSSLGFSIEGAYLY